MNLFKKINLISLIGILVILICLILILMDTFLFLTEYLKSVEEKSDCDCSLYEVDSTNVTEAKSINPKWMVTLFNIIKNNYGGEFI